jgi:GTPase SAR1 family protein
MNITVTISEYNLTIKTREGNETLPPYFYFFQNKALIGKKVEKSIDLYPDYIFNLFIDEDQVRVEAFFKELQQYIAKKYSGTIGNISIHPQWKRFEKVLKKVIPKASVNFTGKRGKSKKLPIELEKNFDQAFAAAISNELIKTCRIPGSLYEKIQRIVQLRLPIYFYELLETGKTDIRMKVVDRCFTVRMIHEELNVQHPSIRYLMEIYKQSYLNHDQVVRALYNLYEGSYKVTFISPFSFGKSTLINGILGEEMLNMDIRAETAIITKVVNADHKRLFAKYENNRIEMYSYETITELKDKLKDLTGVRSKETPNEVQIHYPLPHLPGISIIDAPGLNSRHSDHNSKASESLRISDLILFLINPNNIGEANFAAQMKEFLEIIKESTKNYGFVLSKLDLYSDDYEVIMKEMEIVLQDLDPEYQMEHLFFVSGYFALYGKLFAAGKIDIHDIRKNRSIFIIEEDEMIMGRLIEPHHSDLLVQFSQIERLEDFIRERGEHHESNQLDLDRREQKATGVTSAAKIKATV